MAPAAALPVVAVAAIVFGTARGVSDQLPAAPATPVALEKPAPAVQRRPVVRHRDAVPRAALVSVRAARTLAALVPKPRPVQPGPHLIAHPSLATSTAASGVETATAMTGPLTDPTPAPRRLAPGTAQAILAAAQRRGVDWAMLAAVLRYNGSGWPNPSSARVRRAAAWLAGSHTPLDESLVALAQYDRTVGIDALISGLESAKPLLGAQVLRDPRISIYRAGQQDIEAGRVDVRVLAALLFLARREGEVTVTSLVSDHPDPVGGGRSAHAFGAAFEIGSLAGRPVADIQQPGGELDGAVHALLYLPPEVRPRQIRSLLDFGGSSIALADYRDRVDISFDPYAPPATDRLKQLWELAGARYGVPWRILAAINEIETHNGQNLGPSSAGAVGWMQFLPSTWAMYGVDANGDGIADPSNPADAIFSAARYLAASGAATNLRRAILAYNHAGWYADDVLRMAARIN
jgi:hypothetical protein